MKLTLLFAMLSMAVVAPAAPAATELETLRARCTEQERQIEQLKEQVRKLQPVPTTQTESAAPTTSAPTTSASPPRATAIYIVRPGDFLEKIARKNHCSAAALAKANGLKSDSMIHPGQKLKLPAPPLASTSLVEAAPSAPALSGKTHTIQQGETYSSISRKYGVSVQTLVSANPDAKATELRPGRVIQLSTAPAPETKPQPAIAPAPPTPAGPAPSPAIPSPPVEPGQIVESPPTSAPQEDPVYEKTVRKIHSVMIETEMTYAAFAAKHGTDIGRLNDLNGLDLVNSTILAKGSELYVPAQP